ncbi:hypothetical protein B0I35DRAFT_410731 [Stachybotrys elegans]|uniref:SnoaL-like domain-containing protein n=1 Tax=Stachybotrys elegans TaxID=80388 RepID=A0A8K0SJC0_9HYPO|nr:hypothetical protein B0I35DRAFT_410731 [Stachybotrys elegans]
MTTETESEVHAHLREIYATYWSTPSPEEKKAFFSPSCRQICRSDPSYAARDRDAIVAYLHEAGDKFKHLISDSPTHKGIFTMRPLTEEERRDFGSEEYLGPAGFTSVEEVREQAAREGWVGMRVDLWDDDGRDTGMMVKVQYWWRREDGVWLQILHDILSIGSVDGSQGKMVTL